MVLSGVRHEVAGVGKPMRLICISRFFVFLRIYKKKLFCFKEPQHRALKLAHFIHRSFHCSCKRAVISDVR